MKAYDVLIQECDSDIRAGRPQDVARRLAKFETARIPRFWRLPLAKICRRAGLYQVGLALLARLVNSPNRNSAIKASAAEVAEYAALLLRYGAVPEAEDYLASIDASQAPDSLLYRAYAFFMRWEFAGAIPHLERYLQFPLAPYAKLVGQTNLAYALVESRRHGAALKLLEEVIQKTRAEKHLLLECNCLAYRAQVYFQQNELARAQQEIVEAKRHFAITESNDHFLIVKWEMVLYGMAAKSVQAFTQLRGMAIRSRDWATSREADLFSLKIEFNEERFLHLYFGSPFPQFRQNILDELGVHTDRIMYVLGPKKAPRLDIQTGEIDGVPALKPGRRPHQLMEVLLRDFYEPLRVASVFSALMPGEHFDVASSPDRIHKIIRRTRRWLLADKIPARILCEDGFYSLKIDGKFSFRVPLERKAVEPIGLHFQELQRVYRQTPAFSAKEAREKLSLSKTTVRRLLDWGIEQKKIIQLGHSNREASYRLASYMTASQKNAA